MRAKHEQEKPVNLGDGRRRLGQAGLKRGFFLLGVPGLQGPRIPSPGSVSEQAQDNLDQILSHKKGQHIRAHNGG